MYYAHDVTQIIKQRSKSQKFMAITLDREINSINMYKKKWKIKINTGKFKIIPLAIMKIPPVKVDGKEIPYSNEGLHFKKEDIMNHMKNNKNRAHVALIKIKRFGGLPPNIKLTLIKACGTPILAYPHIH